MHFLYFFSYSAYLKNYCQPGITTSQKPGRTTKSQYPKLSKNTKLTTKKLIEKDFTASIQITTDPDETSLQNNHLILLISCTSVLLTLAIGMIIVLVCVIRNQQKPTCRNDIERVRMPSDSMY